MTVADTKGVGARGSPWEDAATFSSPESTAWEVRGGGGDGNPAQTTFLAQVRSVQVNSQVAGKSSQLSAQVSCPRPLLNNRDSGPSTGFQEPWLAEVHEVQEDKLPPVSCVILPESPHSHW